MSASEDEDWAPSPSDSEEEAPPKADAPAAVNQQSDDGSSESEEDADFEMEEEEEEDDELDDDEEEDDDDDEDTDDSDDDQGDGEEGSVSPGTQAAHHLFLCGGATTLVWARALLASGRQRVRARAAWMLMVPVCACLRIGCAFARGMRCPADVAGPRAAQRARRNERNEMGE